MTEFITAHQAWALPLVFLVSFGESFAFVSLLVPGTALLMACGAVVGTGLVSAWEVLAGAIAGAVLGDSVSYWLGRRWGRQIIQAWPMNRYPGMVAKGEAFLRKHGTSSVCIGRFFGPVRAIVPLLAGMAHMPRRAFWIANVGSAIVWAPLVMFPGAVAAWVVRAGQDWTTAAAGVLAAAAAGAAAWWWRKRMERGAP